VDVDGVVLGSTGYRDEVSATSQSVRWAVDGSVEVIPAYRPSPQTSTAAVAISHGTVVGYEEYGTAESPIQALVWAPGTAPVPLGSGLATEVNARGSIVVERLPEAKLWLLQDGAYRSLPTDTSPFSTGDVVALTDDDVVYGMYRQTPVRWVCDPEAT
jgi:hypothetical protein